MRHLIRQSHMICSMGTKLHWIYLPGKVCFVCEDARKQKELVKGRQCANCLPALELPLSCPGVLVHMAGHFHFDLKTNVASEPCGLCLHPLPHCTFCLKKGKDTNSGVQIDYEKSTCANLLTFSYSVTASSTSSSPCSNVPIVCPWCLKSEPAVWQYNMLHHVKLKHPHVSLRENKDMWKIGNS